MSTFSVTASLFILPTFGHYHLLVGSCAILYVPFSLFQASPVMLYLEISVLYSSQVRFEEW